MATMKFDVIVIGGGVMGSSTAYHAAKARQSVLLLEQFDFLHRRGSSHGDSRITRRTYPEDHYTRMMPYAYDLWRQIEEDSQTQLYTKTGGLDFGPSTSKGIQDIIKASQKHQVKHEILGPAEVAARWPTLQFPENYLAVFQEDGGILNASKAVAALQSLARKYGAVLKDREAVGELKHISNDEVIIRTNKGTYIAKSVVVTPGAWIGPFAEKHLGLNLDVVVNKTTIGYFACDDPAAYSAERFPVFLHYHEPFIYGTPSLEYPGLLKAACHYGEVVTADTRTFHPSTQALLDEVYEQTLKLLYKGVQKHPVHSETCLYTLTPDTEFIIDRHPVYSNIYIGGGFSGHGFKLASVVGKILSDLSSQGHTQFDLRPFNIARVMKANERSRL